jgi:glucose uptake protein
MWANLFKAAGGKWRFELFYFDFAFGLILAATVLALTVGSLGFDGFSFEDDLRLAGKRQDLFGFVAGGIFNLGNMLLLGAVSMDGIAVAFPAGMGVALIVSGLWNFTLNPGGNTLFLMAGIGLIAVAIVFDILAYKKAGALREQTEAAPVTTLKLKKPKKRKNTLKGLVLSLAGGLLLGSFPPLLQMGRTGENGLGPYSIGFMFALGAFFSTFVFNLFFMNLPVQGDPIEMAEYFRARLGKHVLGFASGVIWYIGLTASLVSFRVEGKARIAPSISFGLLQCGIVIAVLSGLFMWREYHGVGAPVKIRLGLMVFLLLAGLGLLSAGLATPVS